MASMAAMLAASEAARKTVISLKSVELDGQVVLKIMQHCNEALPHLVTGQLLGLDVGQTLEVTDCFPFPASMADNDDGEEGDAAAYQLDMMRCLREVNVDNNSVGWYQSTNMGTFQTAELIETFVNYYENNIRRCVCLVYDPQRSSRGGTALRAIRLQDAFIDMFKEGKLTGKDLREADISWRDVFVEIPIKVRNSALATAVLAALEPDCGATQGDVARLDVSYGAFMEKNIESLVEVVDDLFNEQQKVTLYHKNVARLAQQQAAWLQKRRQENQARRAAGEEPLAEEDPALFKALPEPLLLDSYLISSQMASYCDQLNSSATLALQKLYVMDAFQKGNV